MRYRMMGIDLDGTLLGPDGEVSQANRRALQRAHDAGVMLVPCTGRAWHESHMAVEGLPGLEVGVFVTGGIINEVASGRALTAHPFNADEAREVLALLEHLPDAVLVFSERDKAGYDYMVTGRGELAGNTRWWLELTQARVQTRDQLDDEALMHAVRVGVVSTENQLSGAEQMLVDSLGGRVNVHVFPGLGRADKGESVEILEVFPAGVNKWTGLQWVARQHEIDDEQIAVIGDQVNDLPMLRGAGCGIAMANGAESAKSAADRQTLTNTEDGLAYALERLLDGRW